jgi:hypothetical protein
LTLSLSGTLTGGIASSPAAGDLVIAHVFGPSATTDRELRATGDGTWTDYTEGTELFANDGRDTNFTYAYKFMGETPDTEIEADSFNAAGNYGSILGATVWRYVNATPLDVATTTATGTNTHMANAPASNVPQTTGAVVLAVCAGSALPGATNVPSLSGFTTRLAAVKDSNSCGAKLLVASQAWNGSGAVDPAVWTDSDTVGDNDSWAAYTIVLKPAG